MWGADQRPGTRRSYEMIAPLCLVAWGISTAALASAQPSSQQMEQQRRVQAELRDALERSERRIAASQAQQLREAEERSEEERRAQAEANRRREAEQRKEALLIQARAQAQQSNPQKPQDATKEAEAPLPEAASAPLSTAGAEVPPRRHLLMRSVGLVLMIGATFAALFVLRRIVQEHRAG